MTRAAFLAPLALLALTACSTDGGDYPSLAPRAIERTGDALPDRPTLVATPDATLDATIAGLADDLKTAADRFTPAAAQARTSVAAARSAGAGSEAWLDAQTALAELDGYRADSTAALGKLDDLSIARASRLDAPYPALDALGDRGQAQVDAENATITALQKQLPGS